MSRQLRPMSLVVTAAAALALAPAADAAVTETPLGSCAAPNVNKQPSFGRLSVTNPVRVSAGGSPSGKLGLTVRTKASQGEGSALRVQVDLMGLDGGRFGGGEFITQGCSRLSIPLVDLSTAAPLILPKNQLFILRVGVGYTEAPMQTDPFAMLLRSLTGSQFTGFLTR